MNHRAPPRRASHVRLALLCVSLVLLPGLTPAGPATLLHVPVRGRSRPTHRVGVVPYLPIVGPPPLRFRESSPPPDLAAKPAAAAPPEPSAEPAEAAERGDAGAPSALAAPTSTTSPTQAAADDSSPPAKVPVPILHDHLRPVVRPEDFLPYFQFPGTSRGGDARVIVPVQLPSNAPAAPIPPSTATYSRTPE